MSMYMYMYKDNVKVIVDTYIKSTLKIFWKLN